MCWPRPHPVLAHRVGSRPGGEHPGEGFGSAAAARQLMTTPSGGGPWWRRRPKDTVPTRRNPAQSEGDPRLCGLRRAWLCSARGADSREAGLMCGHHGMAGFGPGQGHEIVTPEASGHRRRQPRCFGRRLPATKSLDGQCGRREFPGGVRVRSAAAARDRLHEGERHERVEDQAKTGIGEKPPRLAPNRKDRQAALRAAESSGGGRDLGGIPGSAGTGAGLSACSRYPTSRPSPPWPISITG